MLWRLTHHLAVRSRCGIVWGDPVALQRELGMTSAPDLSWLIQAGWCVYISDAEKDRRERDAVGKQTPATETKAKATSKPKQRVGAGRTSPAPGKKRVGNAARERAAAAHLVRHPDMTAKDLACQLSCHTRTVYRLRAWRDLRRQRLTCDTRSPEERRAEEQHSSQAHTIQSGTGRDHKAQSKRVRGQRQQSRAHERPAEARGTGQGLACRQQATGRPVEPVRNPTKPEAGGAVPKSPGRRTAAPLASLPPGVTQLGRILRPWWIDAEARKFGEAITSALWPGRSLDTDDAKSEVACFANWWVQLKAAGLADHDGYEHCVAKAKEIRKYGKSARRPGAIMRDILHKMFEARAGPLEA